MNKAIFQSSRWIQRKKKPVLAFGTEFKEEGWISIKLLLEHLEAGKLSKLEPKAEGWRGWVEKGTGGECKETREIN